MNTNKIRGFEPVSADNTKHSNLEIQLPVRGDVGSAGYDFFSNDSVMIRPGEKFLFWTDVKAYMQQDEVLKLYIRSSLGTKQDLVIANGTGIIDASYYNNPSNEGNIGICLYNRGEEAVEIKQGDRIAQGIFSKYLVADNDSVLKQERTGGFGSSNQA